MTAEYAEALSWLDQQFPGKGSLRPAEVAQCFNCKMTTAREACKKYGVKIGDPCIPKPVAAKMIAAKMRF